MAININREVEDTFYRYKMPKLSAKVEGKGNGIKTVIVNVSDIAKSLYRKPIYVTKFFGCELGAQIHVDEKNERYIVNGAHEATKLQEILDGFIKKFVLCQSCGNPETTMHVNKKLGTVSTICKACGSRGHLDVTHRLTQYIVKNPPDPEVSSSKPKSKKNKKNRNETDKISDDDNGALTCDDKRTNTNGAENENDDDWFEESTTDARQQRINNLSVMAKSLALCDDVDKSEAERADTFYKHLTQFHGENIILQRACEIKKEAERLHLGARAVLVLVEVLFTEPSIILTDIKKYAPLFVLFTRSGDEHKRAQHYMWGAIAKLIERYEAFNLLAKSCHILKQLYDCDILEEDVILMWYDKGPSKKFVSRELSALIIERCGPMINWLREAEEEDSDLETSVQLVNTESNNYIEDDSDITDRSDTDEEVDIDAI